MKKISILSIIFILFITCAVADGFGNAKSLSLGDAYHSKVSGFHAVNWNSARLGLEETHLTFNLLHLDSRVYNNSISLGKYNETVGDSLSHSEKSDIYDNIPSSGFQLIGNTQACVPITSFSIGKIGFVVKQQNAGYFNLPKDLFHLLLFGNEIEQQFDFSDADVKIVSYIEPKVGFGTNLHPEKLLPFYENYYPPIYGGINVGYILGLGYAKVDQITSEFVVNNNGYASITNDITLKSAGIDTVGGDLEFNGKINGTGFRSDISLFSPINEKLSVGLTLRNLFGKIKWDGDCKLIHTELYSDTININTWDDSLVVDTTYSISSFEQDIPLEMHLSASYKLAPLQIFIDYIQGFEKSVFTSTKPKISLGAEWYANDWLPVRAGFGFGGLEGTHFSLGTGFEIGAFEFNWAGRHYTSPFYGSTGVGLAADLILKF